MVAQIVFNCLFGGGRQKMCLESKVKGMLLLMGMQRLVLKWAGYSI